jgi:hypothetical protein
MKVKKMGIAQKIGGFGEGLRTKKGMDLGDGKVARCRGCRGSMLVAGD